MQARVAFAFVLSAAAFTQIAHASPAIRTEVKPSAFFVFANNSEDRSYNCSISYTWSHDDYGTRKSQQINTVASVAPKSNGVIHSLQGSYVRLQIDSGPNIQCN